MPKRDDLSPPLREPRSAAYDLRGSRAPYHRGQSARTVQAGYIARRAEEAHAGGASYKDIAKSFGMNPRTLYEVRTGQTSARTVFHRGMKRPAKAAEVSFFDVIVRDDSDTTIKRADRTHKTVTVLVPTGRSRFQAYQVAQAPNAAAVVGAELAARAELFARTGQGSPPFRREDLPAVVIVSAHRREQRTMRHAPLLFFERDELTR